jgi:hypothetical protein
MSRKTSDVGAACRVCGAHDLVAREEELTEKQRVKFGIFWLFITIITAGIGFLIWLIMPRKNVVVGVDRYLECKSCGARQ